MKKKIYIAGPMRGYPYWNFLAFDDAQARWEADGWHVFNPAVLCRALGYAGFDDADAIPECREKGRPHLKHVMSSDIACLYAADAVALLPGWERSKGAAVEVAVGVFLGLEFYDAVTMERLVVTGRLSQQPKHIDTNGA